jgi:hypothetical protein
MQYKNDEAWLTERNNGLTRSLFLSDSDHEWFTERVSISIESAGESVDNARSINFHRLMDKK